MKQEPCGCCEGTEILTPMPTANRPGLSALAYRIGTHATFLETMKARLTEHYLEIDSGRVDQHGRAQMTRIRPLQGLTTRDGADPAIALLDAWATVADVLTFYQERIANEGFLPTATERHSILEMARLVGYELHPGVASSVYLAFTLEEGYEVEIPAGTRAQSLPGPGELPQPFETASPLLARAEWNELLPRMAAPHIIAGVMDTLYLEGTDLLLARGDPLLIDSGGLGPSLYRIAEVEPDPVAEHTKVTLREWPVPGVTTGEPQPLPDSLRKENLNKLFQDLVHGELTEDEVSEMVAEFGDALLLTFRMLAKMPASPERARVLQLIVQTLLETREAIARIDTFPPQSYVHQALGRLQTWIDTVLEILQAHLPGIIITHTPVPEPAVSVITATTAFSELVQTLIPAAPPAAIAPPSPYHLVTEPSITFSKGSDFVYRALASIYRGLKAKMLYTAVQNIGPYEPGEVKVYALRTRAAPFGHNAPPRPGKYGASGGFTPGGEWAVDDPMDLGDAAQGDELHHEPSTLYLDQECQIEPDSWIVIATPSILLPVKLDEAEGRSATATSLTAYGLGGKSTRIELGEEKWFDNPAEEPFSTIRGTNVYVDNEELSLARVPITTEVKLDTIELAGIYDGLVPGRWLIVSGERTDTGGIPGIYDSELVMLANVEQHAAIGKNAGDASYSELFLGNQLAHTYKRDTVKIYGNVVKATHGETRQEVLGSGDGSQAWQQYTLKQSPLTHVSAATPKGIESTLQVRVNQVLWHEAGNLARLKANDRRYLTQTDNEDRTTVVFGDGQHGARPPTGGENIRAEYRNGIGRAGNAAAEQISLLATRPLGVKAVINPQAATGGADRETGDQARRSIPASVTALDRLVSVQDYADFAQTFAGIGKASATVLRDGRRQFLCLTIAGADNIPIAETSDLFLNLGRALRKFGDPDLPIRLQLVELMLLIVRARIRLHPDYLWEAVAPEIENALLEAFGFEQRDLGQDVQLGEVIRVIQGVEGVVYVDVDLLESLSKTEFEDEEAFNQKLSDLAGEGGGIPARPKPRIPVHQARIDPARQLLPAQLAILSPDVPATLTLEVIQS